MSFESFVGEVVAAAEDGSEKLVETVHNTGGAGTEAGENAQQTAEQSASDAQEETAKQVISLLETAETALCEAIRTAADILTGQFDAHIKMVSEALISAKMISEGLASGGAGATALALFITSALIESSAEEPARRNASRVLNEVQTTLEQLLAARHSAQARQYALMRMGQISRDFIAIRRHRRVLRPYQGELKIILPALQRIHQPLLRLIQIQRQIALKDHTQAAVSVLERLNRALTNTISALQLAANRPRRSNLQKHRRF